MKKKKIRMTLPIHVINREEVETSSQFVEIFLNEIEIQTYPRYLPDLIELDASKLKEKENLTVADLNIGEDENIEILEEKDKLIAILTLAEDMVEEIEEEVEEADVEVVDGIEPEEAAEEAGEEASEESDE